MSIVRSMLLAASQNQWLRHHATNYGFVKHSVSRFMPGETLADALGAAENLRSRKIGTVLTHLGENVKDRAEAQQVTERYLEVLERFQQKDLPAEISVKLTQLGLDLSPELCFDHLNAIISRAPKSSIVWVDMEASNYVDATLESAFRPISIGQKMILPNFCLCVPPSGWSKGRTTSLLKSLFPANGMLTKTISRWPRRC